MLDQYRQDLNSDNDHLGEGRYQTSRRKMVFTLAGASLALLFFLFIIGAFRSEDEVTSEKETQGAVASELTDLQARVEKLEQLLQGGAPLAAKAQDNQQNNALNDNSLKALIASTEDPIGHDIDMPTETAPQEMQSTTVQEVQQPAPQKAAPKTYVIQKGDTLSKISQKFYGTTKKWKSIYEANRDRINNINNLKVGTQIVIPDDSK